jgi:hypothetical protein
MTASQKRGGDETNGTGRAVRLIVLLTLIVLAMFLLCVPGRGGLDTTTQPAPTGTE